MTKLLQVMFVVLAAAAVVHAGPAPRGGLLDKWSGGTDNPDYQISNLANSGMLVSHDLNTGDVVVDGSKYRRLSGREQRVLRDWLQTYQTRNSPKQISLHMDNQPTDVVTEPVAATAAVAGTLFKSVASVASAVKPDPQPQPQMAHRPVLRVLCVEDSVDHAKQLRTAMHGSRINLLAAPNVKVAGDWLARNEVDALLIALNQPGQPARATLDQARAFAGRMPVIILAAFDDESMRRDAIARGFQDFAPKANLNVATLQYMIENSVDRFRMRTAAASTGG